MTFINLLSLVSLAFCAVAILHQGKEKNLIVSKRKIFNNSFTVPSIHGLDCFACHSINGSDRRCEDPMIRIYEAIIKPETCVLPTKIIRPKENKVEQNLGVDVVTDVNGTALEKGPGYEVETQEIIKESYCVKIIGTTSKYLLLFSHFLATFCLLFSHFSDT